jgi:hypothetical protein
MMGRLKSDQGQLFYEFHLGNVARCSGSRGLCRLAQRGTTAGKLPTPYAGSLRIGRG